MIARRAERRRSAFFLVLSIAVGACSGSPAASNAPTSGAEQPSVAPSIPVTKIASTMIPLANASDMSVSGHAIWLLTGSTVSSLDLTTKAVTSMDVGSAGDELDGLEVTDQAIWIADFGGNKVIRVDRSGGSVPKAIPVEAAEDVLAVGDTIWVTRHHAGSISRIDAKTGAILGTQVVGASGQNGPQRLAQAAGSVWVDESNTSEVIRLDPATGNVVARIHVPDFGPCGGILATDSAVWATGCHDSLAAVRIDPATNTIAAEVLLDGYAQDVVQVNGAYWIPVGGNGYKSPGQSSEAGGEIERIDPQTNVVTTKLTTDGLDDVAGSVVADNALWVSNGTTSVLDIPLSELTP